MSLPQTFDFLSDKLNTDVAGLIYTEACTSIMADTEKMRASHEDLVKNLKNVERVMIMAHQGPDRRLRTFYERFNILRTLSLKKHKDKLNSMHKELSVLVEQEKNNSGAWETVNTTYRQFCETHQQLCKDEMKFHENFRVLYNSWIKY